jgi:alpha,alpha-trehalose phosphorylase
MTSGAAHTPPPVRDQLDRHRFPVEPWKLVEAVYESGDLGRIETMFAVGNGYIGMRGNVEEARPWHAHGTFINGFHETWTIRHAEEAFGFARVGQTIVNVPDAKTIKLYIDDEPLMLPVADLLSYNRALDFADGVLRRSLVWRTPAGKRVQIESQRMVSFRQRHLAVMTFEITMLDDEAPVVLSSQLLNRQDGEDEYTGTSQTRVGEASDPRKAERFEQRALQPKHHWAEGSRMALGFQTTSSRMTIACAADHTLETTNRFSQEIDAGADMAKLVYRVQAKPGQPIRLTKAVVYHTSRGVPVVELIDRCHRTLDRVVEEGIERQFREQRAWMDEYWARCDVEIADQPAMQQAVRWNLFQTAQAVGRAEGMGVPAKGVSGSGYGGHYFWDTEVYVLPFLTYTSPLLARNALRFRYSMLPAANRRAAELQQEGALFPWRTINGEEASAYYAAGTAQYHIDADIAYALSKYVDATGDADFLSREAIDILVQTARMWADLGFWGSNGDNSFHIHGVTGPDEYTTVVNDNLFTNVMARYNLSRAAFWAEELERTQPQAYGQMVARLSLHEGEVDEWRRAAKGMFIPFDESLGIHPQDSHFLEREVWDLSSPATARRPLLLHYHPLVIYRFQVLKQADVVLALFLQGQRFTPEEKRRNFEYYDPITTGDSTLSAVVQSIIAGEVGYADLALRYFNQALYVDLADLHGNSSDGVHVASTGGIWNALAFGFGGMRDHNGRITFDPRLPDTWPSLTFRVTLRGTRFRVRLTCDQVVFTIETGTEARFAVRGHDVVLTADAPVTIALDGQGPKIEGGLQEHSPHGSVLAHGESVAAADIADS